MWTACAPERRPWHRKRLFLWILDWLARSRLVLRRVPASSPDAQISEMDQIFPIAEEIAAVF